MAQEIHHWNVHSFFADLNNRKHAGAFLVILEEQLIIILFLQNVFSLGPDYLSAGQIIIIKQLAYGSFRRILAAMLILYIFMEKQIFYPLVFQGYLSDNLQTGHIFFKNVFQCAPLLFLASYARY
jgi:hypothetical protein